MSSWTNVPGPPPWPARVEQVQHGRLGRPATKRGRNRAARRSPPPASPRRLPVRAARRAARSSTGSPPRTRRATRRPGCRRRPAAAPRHACARPATRSRGPAAARPATRCSARAHRRWQAGAPATAARPTASAPAARRRRRAAMTSVCVGISEMMRVAGAGSATVRPASSTTTNGGRCAGSHRRPVACKAGHAGASAGRPAPRVPREPPAPSQRPWASGACQRRLLREVWSPRCRPSRRRLSGNGQQQKTRLPPGRTGRRQPPEAAPTPAPLPGRAVSSGTNGAGLLARGGAAHLPRPRLAAQWSIGRSTPVGCAPSGPLTVAGPRRSCTGLPEGPVRDLCRNGR
jgi:hypothetical protein